ncbi:hypothetical protein RFI_20278, partial [Reticulomyxa filosa]
KKKKKKADRPKGWYISTNTNNTNTNANVSANANASTNANVNANININTSIDTNNTNANVRTAAKAIPQLKSSSSNHSNTSWRYNLHENSELDLERHTIEVSDSNVDEIMVDVEAANRDSELVAKKKRASGSLSMPTPSQSHFASPSHSRLQSQRNSISESKAKSNFMKRASRSYTSENDEIELEGDELIEMSATEDNDEHKSNKHF